jgi:hypothetical protein
MIVVTGRNDSDEWRRIASLTWPGIERYAASIGAEFRGHVCHRGFARPESWRKLVHICDALSDSDEVLWIDSDVVVAESCTDNIFSQIPPEAFHAMAFLSGNPPHFNAGVWALRRRILPSLMLAAMQDDLVHHSWWEQAAMHRVMESMPASSIATLDESWNHWTGSSGEITPRFRHACGLRGEERIQKITEWLHAPAAVPATEPVRS